MAKLDDEGWSFTEVSGSAKVLVVDHWLFMVCSETLSSGTGCSGTVSSGTKSMLVIEVICWLGSCCWGLYVITSSEAMSETLSWFDSYSGSSPE